MPRDEVLGLRLGDLGVRLGEQPVPAREGRGGAVRRAVLVRRAEREHLPPRLPGRLEPVHEAVRLVAETPAGKRGGVEEDAAGAIAELQGWLLSRRGPRPDDDAHDARPENAAAAHPHHEREAGRGLRPPSGQALGRRPRRRAGDGLPRRPRDPRRAGPLPRPRREALALGAARAALERPLRRLVRGRRGRALGVPRRGLDRPRRHLARRAAPQGRGRRARPHERARGGRGAARPEEADRREGARLDEDRTSTASSAATPLELDVDRPLGRFGAWYELFPRSFGGFKGVEKVLPQLAELGFDVVYFPPIHPIGTVVAEGPQQHAAREAGRPGQPVGDRLGGGRPRRDPSRARHARRLRPPRRGRDRSSASRSRSTSRSSARPTTRG